MTRFMFSTVIVCVLCGSVPKALIADDHKDDATELAREYYAKGEVLFEDESYLEAAIAFKRAYEISPNLTVLPNIGYCYEYAKDYPNAIITYRQYLEQSGDSDPATAHDIRNRLSELQMLVGELHVKCNIGECAVEVDGVYKGETTNGVLIIVMPPGKYMVMARRNDHLLGSAPHRVEAGQKTYARFGKQSDATVEAPPQQQDLPVGEVANRTIDKRNASRSRFKTPFWVLSGGALVGGVLVVAFGALTLKANNEYDDSGNRDPDARDKAQRYKLVTNISIAATAAFVAGALTFKVLEFRSKRRGESLALSLNLRADRSIIFRGEF